MTTIKANCISDAAHGWLSVAIKDLRMIKYPVENITQFSYMNATRVYLEEDDDCTRFMKWAKENNIKVDMKNSRGWSERSFVRSLPGFSLAWYKHGPIQVGGRYSYKYKEESRIFSVTNIKNKKVYFTNEENTAYSPTSVTHFMLCTLPL